MNNKNQPEFHIRSSKDMFGKRGFAFGNRDNHSKLHFIITLIITIVVGVSVPYFFIDVGLKVYNHTLVTYLEKPQETSASTLESDEVPNNPSEHVLIPSQKSGDNGQYYFQSSGYKDKIPTTSGLAYVVGDVDTGEIIISKNSDAVFPIASVSKLITSLVAKENMDQHSTITVTRSSIDTYGTSGGLRLGEKILVSDLYYPLLMESSNDAAEVFAEGYGFDSFIKLMNAKAKELGMKDTSFAEPSGLSPKNVSTADDLFKLAMTITKDHPDIWDVTRVRGYTILKHAWGNSSVLSRKSNFVGGKNGYTWEANQTVVVVLNVSLEGGPRRIAITLLKSNNREGDVEALERFVSKWVGYLAPGASL